MSGPMVVTEHDEKVNSSEVDSIHGAKPEPEERPLVVEMKLEKGSGEAVQQDGTLILETYRAKTVAIELTVEERAALLGKQCSNCLHWRHALGQVRLEKAAFFGAEEDRAHLKSLFAELTEQGGAEAAGEEYVEAGEVFAPTYAEKAMSRMGLCVRATNAVKEDVLTMGDGHCAGPNIPEIAKDIWEAKDSDTAKRVAQMRDALFGAASTVTP